MGVEEVLTADPKAEVQLLYDELLALAEQA